MVRVKDWAHRRAKDIEYLFRERDRQCMHTSKNTPITARPRIFDIAAAMVGYKLE